ncbi:hypothetical protein G7Y79_00006g018530 [Physcia stellaris]|nr:hypothetical protein G7Y79_00006g018530 [Physcia stellaris]
MQQRINQLEKDLEDTRLQLFKSEEAHALEKATRLKDHLDSLDYLDKTHGAEVNRMKEDHQSEKAALKENHDREQEAQVYEHERLLVAHQQEVKAMKAEHATKIEGLENRLAQYAAKEAELTQKEQRLEQIVAMALKFV